MYKCHILRFCYRSNVEAAGSWFFLFYMLKGQGRNGTKCQKYCEICNSSKREAKSTPIVDYMLPAAKARTC